MGLAKDNENFEEDLQGLSEELNKEKSEKLKVEKVLADAAHALKLVLTVCTCIVIFWCNLIWWDPLTYPKYI